MTATVLDRVTPTMRIYSEESFGPIVCMIRVAGDEEAIRVANEGEYRLSSAVFSQDIVRALRSRNESEPAFVISMGRRFTMKHRCHSGA
jgi:acyl-CoA reductase-like NAD-dependent aldehyde dehydrogenase